MLWRKSSSTQEINGRARRDKKTNDTIKRPHNILETLLLVGKIGLSILSTFTAFIYTDRVLMSFRPHACVIHILIVSIARVDVKLIFSCAIIESLSHCLFGCFLLSSAWSRWFSYCFFCVNGTLGSHSMSPPQFMPT